MKKILIILLICGSLPESILGKCDLSESNCCPLVGLHGTMSPNIVNNLNAQCVRTGFSDYHIKTTIDSGGQEVFLKIQELDQLGIEIIVYLKWPEDPNNSIGPDPERIPVGEDREEVLEYLEIFLLNIGPYTDWIQISQEPLGNTYYDDSIYSPDEVIEWWETVAIFIRDTQIANPDLSHLEIMTGGITGVKGQLDSNGDPNVAEAIGRIITFGEEFCDAVDIHLHTDSVDLGTQEIEWLEERTNMPLTTTEWSQAHIVRTTGWLFEYNEEYGTTNRNVIENAYDNPMTPEQWQDFIANSPYTPGFIPAFYNVLNEHCFLHACYGGAVQYGSPAFDWCQLIASKTTDHVSRNQPFYDEYVSLDFNINCGFDMFDFATFTGTWLLSDGQEGYDDRCDIDGSDDGYIGLADFKVFAKHWLKN